LPEETTPVCAFGAASPPSKGGDFRATIKNER